MGYTEKSYLKKLVFLILEPKFFPFPGLSCWVVTILLFLWKLFSTNKRKESNDQARHGHCCSAAGWQWEQQLGSLSNKVIIMVLGPLEMWLGKLPVLSGLASSHTHQRFRCEIICFLFKWSVTLLCKMWENGFPKESRCGSIHTWNRVSNRNGWPAFSSCLQVHTNFLTQVVISSIHTNDL